MSDPAPTTLVGHTARARGWLASAALPLWAGIGIDRERGGVYEALDLAGTPLGGLDKRVRVQARQIYVFSHAAVLGWPPGRDAAWSLFEYLTGHAWHPEGGFVHLLTPDGQVRDGTRDTYDHAFILLALAWLYRATGEEAVKRALERTWEAAERHLWDPATRSFHEALPRALPRRQNPHMHWLEAMLAVADATGEPRAGEQARRMVGLFEERFVDPAAGALREYFDADWQPASGPPGRLVEPGHHCEWVWLLREADRRLGTDTRHWQARLYGFVGERGRDPATGAMVDEIDLEGTRRRGTMRCWPQTEAIKAEIVRLEAGERDAEVRLIRLLDVLFARYLAIRPEGLWIDQFTAEGTPLSTTVPASTLYHLFCAMAELMRIAGTAGPRPLALPVSPSG